MGRGRLEIKYLKRLLWDIIKKKIKPPKHVNQWCMQISKKLQEVHFLMNCMLTRS